MYYQRKPTITRCGYGYIFYLFCENFWSRPTRRLIEAFVEFIEEFVEFILETLVFTYHKLLIQKTSFVISLLSSLVFCMYYLYMLVSYSLRPARLMSFLYVIWMISAVLFGVWTGLNRKDRGLIAFYGLIIISLTSFAF